MSQYPQRIVCLTEETTETLYLLGQGHRVVGVSGYTVRPPEARQKPRVSAFINPLFDHSPLTMDASSWYAPSSWLVLAFVAVLSVYAYRVALAGRPVLSGAFFRD